MTTFDLEEVRDFAADLNARMDRFEDVDRTEWAVLDLKLRHYARLYRQFCDGVRQWGREVFAGRVAFDPEVEKMWREEGSRLDSHAIKLWAYAEMAEANPSMDEALDELQTAVWDLGLLVNGWVSPKLAVGPSARQGLNLDPAAAEEVRRRIAALPPLPADWQPDDPRQQAMYRRLRDS